MQFRFALAGVLAATISPLALADFQYQETTKVTIDEWSGRIGVPLHELGPVALELDVRFGSQFHPTREGQFSVYAKDIDHVSTLYGSKMPYSMFFSSRVFTFTFSRLSSSMTAGVVASRLWGETASTCLADLHTQ